MSIEEMHAEVEDIRLRLEEYGKRIAAALAWRSRRVGEKHSPHRARVLRPEEMARVGQNLCPGCFRPVVAGKHGRVCRYEAARRVHVGNL